MGLQATAQDYFGVRSPDASSTKLQIFNASTGNVSDSITVTLSGSTIDGYTGLAYNPTNNKLYAIIKAGSTYKLAMVNPSTGQATSIGNLSDQFAGITFTPSGTLYGITSDVANFPSIIYKINPNTAAATLFVVPSGGGNGETIAFNSSDGKIYRYAGGNLFQSIDPSSKVVTDFNILGTVFANHDHSLFYNASSNDFLFTAGNEIYTYSPPNTITFKSIDLTTDGFTGVVATDVVTSVPEVSKGQLKFTIGPNPTRGFIQIFSENPLPDVNLLLYDMSGRILTQQDIPKLDNQVIDLTNYPRGIYIVSIISKQGTTNQSIVIH